MAPQPRNVQELRSFLGLLWQISTWPSHFATPAQSWTEVDLECTEAFEAAKKLLVTGGACTELCLLSNSQECSSTSTTSPLYPCMWPSKPWRILHLDFAGPFMWRMYLIAINTHSKWPVPQPRKLCIIELRRIFAAYGLPEQVMTDELQFVADNFVERFVKTFKRVMRAGKRDVFPLHHRLSKFRLAYHTTPHATTNRTQSELFMGCTLCT